MNQEETKTVTPDEADEAIVTLVTWAAQQNLDMIKMRGPEISTVFEVIESLHEWVFLFAGIQRGRNENAIQNEVLPDA